MYGPNQYPEKLIPRFIKLLKEGKKVTIQGDGSNVRGFLHVYDVARAIEAILTKGKVGEIYNIGSDPEDEFTVLDIAKGLITLVKKDEVFEEDSDFKKYIKYVEDRPFNDKRYFISNQKLKDLGWSITIPFIEGLAALVIAN